GEAGIELERDAEAIEGHRLLAVRRNVDRLRVAVTIVDREDARVRDRGSQRVRAGLRAVDRGAVRAVGQRGARTGRYGVTEAAVEKRLALELGGRDGTRDFRLQLLELSVDTAAACNVNRVRVRLRGEFLHTLEHRLDAG